MYEGILKNLRDIPRDVLKMIEGYLQGQQVRWDNGKYLDWLTMGSVSGFWKGIESRSQAMMESPSVYSIANWLTLGLLDLGKGAIDPERLLSLEHWLDSLGFASALIGMDRVGKRYLELCKVTSNDKIKSGPDTSHSVDGLKVQTIDDLLDGAELGRKTKGKTTLYIKIGTYRQTVDDFYSLNPSNVKDINTNYGSGKTGVLPDGRIITARPGSSDGRPTLEIRASNGKRSGDKIWKIER